MPITIEREGDTIDVVFGSVILHVTKTRKPKSLARIIEEARPGKPTPSFFGKQVTTNSKRIQILTKKQLDELDRLSTRLSKPIRFIVPRGGIPIYFGKDVDEKIEADKRKKKKKHQTAIVP